MTAAQYVALLSHAVGANVASAHDLYQTLNRAGRDITNRERWGWRLVGPTALTLTASSNVFDLPSDFGELIRIDPADGAASPTIMIVDPAEWLDVRNQIRASLGTYWICVEAWKTQASGTAEPTPQGRIHPQPSATDDPDLEISYYRRWTELSSANSTYVPNIPREFENLLLMVARSYAGGLEMQEDIWEGAQIKGEIERLKAAEGRKQPYTTMLRGGVNDMRTNRFVDDGDDFVVTP